MRRSGGFLIFGALVCVLISTAAAAASKSAATAPLGSLKYEPSPAQPVGWRGDGSGRYPAATPPTSWERVTNGAGYATKGIVWMAPMPNIGVGMPIVVGDRIFLTAEVSDLICLEKKSGRLLWIRSNPEFEGLSVEIAKRIRPLPRNSRLYPSS